MFGRCYCYCCCYCCSLVLSEARACSWAARRTARSLLLLLLLLITTTTTTTTTTTATITRRVAGIFVLQVSVISFKSTHGGGTIVDLLAFLNKLDPTQVADCVFVGVIPGSRSCLVFQRRRANERSGSPHCGKAELWLSPF